MKNPGQLRRGDKDEIELVMQCRGWVLIRARLTEMRNQARTALEKTSGQNHADMEGRRCYLLALNEAMELEQNAIREYEEKREAGLFEGQEED